MDPVSIHDREFVRREPVIVGVDLSVRGIQAVARRNVAAVKRETGIP
jgi:hypothetical protein